MMPACESVYVFDDNSTDKTPDICASFDKVRLIRSPFSGLDEARDKNYLLEKVEACGADWILHIDGDEEIEAGGCEEIRNLAERPPGSDCYRFQVLYLWDRPDQVRVDRWYADYRRPSLFRHRPGVRFQSMNGGGFHCGNVPEPRQSGDCGVRLLHYGYMNREDRVRKYQWYNAPDKQPIPAYEDGYRHMVVGDLFPPDSVFRWAGPLELREIRR
jgi:glycosyltransferase involved in cell wall biosynthesis